MNRGTTIVALLAVLVAAFFTGQAVGESKALKAAAFQVVSKDGKVLAEMGQKDGRPFFAMYDAKGRAVWKASVDAPAAKKSPGPTKRTLARDQMKEFRKAMDFYYLENGTYPDTLEELTAPSEDWPKGYIEKIPLDPWGGKYYLRKSDGRPRVAPASPGPDGKPNTDDDVLLK